MHFRQLKRREFIALLGGLARGADEQVGEDVAKLAGRCPLCLVYIGADLKKQESRWACRRSGSSHLNVGLTGLLNPT